MQTVKRKDNETKKMKQFREDLARATIYQVFLGGQSEMIKSYSCKIIICWHIREKQHSGHQIHNFLEHSLSSNWFIFVSVNQLYDFSAPLYCFYLLLYEKFLVMKKLKLLDAFFESALQNRIIMTLCLSMHVYEYVYLRLFRCFISRGE